MVMKGRPVKTENGWEPEFWIPALNAWVIEPGFARPTRRECAEEIEKDAATAYQIDAQQKRYESGMAYACGERE